MLAVEMTANTIVEVKWIDAAKRITAKLAQGRNITYVLGDGTKAIGRNRFSACLPLSGLDRYQ